MADTSPAPDPGRSPPPDTGPDLMEPDASAPVEVVDTASPPFPPPCPTFGEHEVAGTIATDAVVETSGIAASRTWPGTLWLHNDSGDAPRVFAVSYSGESRAEVVVQDAAAKDWEDIALGPGPDGDLLYIGDIGDNARLRDHIVVYRIPEPDLDAPPAVASGVEAFRLTYPDSPHDAETLMVDPLTGDLLIVTKAPGGASAVYQAAAPLDPDNTTALALLTTLPFGNMRRPGSPFPTAGDFSADGLELVVRTYSQGFWWPRDPSAPLATVFDRAPCPVALVTDPKAEAITFEPLSGDLLTVSEGAHPEIRRFSRSP